MSNISQQIKEWEQALKANKAEIKAIETQNKAIEVILKSLRILSGKEEKEEASSPAIEVVYARDEGEQQ